MVTFGLLTDPLNAVPAEIQKFSELGFDYVEIGIEEPLATPGILLEQKEQIIEMLDKYKLFPIGHTAYWVQFGTLHEKARRGWIEEAKIMIDISRELGIKLLNFHFHIGYGRTSESASDFMRYTKNFTESMSELSNYAENQRLILMLENIPIKLKEGKVITNYSFIIKEVPKLLVHFDVAHAFVEGGMTRIKDYIRDFSKEIVHIHISDNHGEKDEHLPLGDGTIDFIQVVRWLKEIDYDSTITFEVFTSEDDAVKSRNYFKEIWEKT